MQGAAFQDGAGWHSSMKTPWCAPVACPVALSRFVRVLCLGGFLQVWFWSAAGVGAFLKHLLDDG